MKPPPWPWPKNAITAAWKNIYPDEKFWLDPSGVLYWLHRLDHGYVSQELYPPPASVKYVDRIDYTIDSMIAAGWIRILIENNIVWYDGEPNPDQRRTLRNIVKTYGGKLKKDNHAEYRTF